MECQQYDSALVALNRANDLNLRVSKSSNELTTIILNHFAATHMKMEQYDQAEKYLNESIKIAINLFGLKDLDLSES